MTQRRDFLEMAADSIGHFANDGRLDADELGRIIAIAERDGRIDQDELRVLTSIIAHVQPNELDAAMQARIAEICSKVSP
jgi:hypothetical protein